ncbi:MAG: anaerobic ribonucleoside-triphosphate reductase activating protein [Candidatus Aminicenantes bacterium]|nr:anaerobic ribonucleoside-triphosphate reductase activating protein [Candidatus Aminicenantes bacterium]
MVPIKGLEKFAPRDFPGFISSTIFLPGCNFRCPYCHNGDLVLHPDALPDIPLDFFIAFLDQRKDWLEGVCVTGGEPLLQPEIEGLLAVIKERRLLVKIDTNGSRPERLARLIEAHLVDWVAMDAKAPLERYPEVVGAPVDPLAIARSSEVIRGSGLPHIFRTTVVPGLVGDDDVRKIGEWLEGAPLYRIQSFSPERTLDPAFESVQPFSTDELKRMAETARPFFGDVQIDGMS